jgi:hypothetical protein
VKVYNVQVIIDEVPVVATKIRLIKNQGERDAGGSRFYEEPTQC